MKPPLFVRSLSVDERVALHAGLRSKEAFELRRSLILLASDDGKTVGEIAATYHCSPSGVLNLIHSFNSNGCVVLHRQSNRPKTSRPILDAEGRKRLQAILQQSPRAFGQERSLWTLSLIAQVAQKQGLTGNKPLSLETIRIALKRLGMNWKSAKHWTRSPDPQYALRKHQRDRLIRLSQVHPDWVLGFEDEVWWSRLAKPKAHAWSDGKPIKLHEAEPDTDDTSPKALCCYGILRMDTSKVMLRFSETRPVSTLTIAFLDWVRRQLVAEGKKAFLLVWDDASWHASRIVREWIRQQNQAARRTGGFRIVNCYLPSKSPWLNNIEPCWAHGKRAVCDPDGVLSAEEIVQRVCAYYAVDPLPPITAEDEC